MGAYFNIHANDDASRGLGVTIVELGMGWRGEKGANNPQFAYMNQRKTKSERTSNKLFGIFRLPFVLSFDRSMASRRKRDRKKNTKSQTFNRSNNQPSMLFSGPAPGNFLRPSRQLGPPRCARRLRCPGSVSRSGGRVSRLANLLTVVEVASLSPSAHVCAGAPMPRFGTPGSRPWQRQRNAPRAPIARAHPVHPFLWRPMRL